MNVLGRKWSPCVSLCHLGAAHPVFEYCRCIYLHTLKFRKLGYLKETKKCTVIFIKSIQNSPI